MIQAIEIGPGPSPAGAKPVAFPFPPDLNRLVNPGFEQTIPGMAGKGGQHYGGSGDMVWNYLFLGPVKAAPGPSRPS